jgi:capsular exopolysaccharide synthesis family protein
MSRVFEALQRSSSEAPNPINTSEATKAPEVIARIGEAMSPLRPMHTFAIPLSPEKRLVAVTDRHGFGTEKLRMLSARLRYAQHRGALKRLLITSTIVGEGKTTITANLAVMLAQQQQQVLVIDGDVHQAALTALFGLGSRPGLGDWWRGRTEFDEFIYRAEGMPLWVLPAGKTVEQPLTMLNADEFQELMQNISNRFDWIIIDSPPLAPLADAATWATIADSVLLVARTGITPKKLLEQNLTLLDRSKLLGIVLNDAVAKEERYYKKYYDHTGKRRPANGTPEASKKS